MKLSEYLKGIEKIYRDASPRYIELVKLEANTRDQIYRTRGNNMLTEEGKEKEINRLRGLQSTYKAEMAAISATAKEKAQKERDRIDRAFYSRFHAVPDALDLPTMELLKSGALTDNEMLHLAEKYHNNVTMTRVIGRYMEQRPNQKMQSIGRQMQTNTIDPHLKAANSLIELGGYMLGGAPLSGSSAAETFSKRFDELTRPIYNAVAAIDGEE